MSQCRISTLLGAPRLYSVRSNVNQTSLTPSCLGRGTDRYRDSQEVCRWVDGGGGEARGGGEGGEGLYLPLHIPHQNDFALKIGSDESRCYVSFIVRGKVSRQCPQNTAFEDGERRAKAGELNRRRPLTGLTPYR